MVSEALLEWTAEAFEAEASSLNMCVAAMRTSEEWDSHPQGKALAGLPPVSLHKIGDAPKREVNGNYHRPLQGIRILDLTRVLAGPVCGRTLASQNNIFSFLLPLRRVPIVHGADVLLITSPNLPDLPPLDIETSRGKRTAQLDLNSESDRETLSTLAQEADVFLQAYRPGGLGAKGFGPAELSKKRPGIVCASLNAYGWDGPWKDRRGVISIRHDFYTPE